LDQTAKRWIVPMPQLWSLWQRHGDIPRWFFEITSIMSFDELIFDSIQLKSSLFQQIFQQSRLTSWRPHFVLNQDDFLDYHPEFQQWSHRARFSILVYKQPSSTFLFALNSIKDCLASVQLVILARNDWHVQNTYRSLPHFVRSRLFVDFPPSLHESDPFLQPAEAASLHHKLKGDFGLKSLSSFCPQLRLMSQLGGGPLDPVRVKEVTQGQESPCHTWFHQVLKQQQKTHQKLESFKQSQNAENQTVSQALPEEIQLESTHYRLQRWKGRYQLLVSSTPTVAIEGHFALFLLPLTRLFRRIKHFVQVHAWRLRPESYPLWWKLRYFPPRVYGLGSRVYWRAHGLGHRVYWRAHSLGHRVYWGAHSLGHRVYWGARRFLAMITYPLFKLYFFSSYQFKKRILGQIDKGTEEWKA
jgi:hypothetical protein